MAFTQVPPVDQCVFSQIDNPATPGLVTSDADWRLVAKPQDVAAAKASVASGAKTRAAKAEIARVIGRR